MEKHQPSTGDDLKEGIRLGKNAINAIKALKTAKKGSDGVKSAAGIYALFGGAVCLISLIVGVTFFVAVVLLVMLPSIITNGLFNLTGDVDAEEYSKNLYEQYEEYALLIDETINEAYELTWNRIEGIMDEYEKKGYDRQAMIDNITGQLNAQADYDTAYILALYSQYTGNDPAKWKRREFLNALKAIQPYMYKLVEPIKEDYYLVSVPYDVYVPVAVNQVRVHAGSSVNGKVEYTFSVKPVTGYYQKDHVAYVESEAGMEIPTFVQSVPIYVPKTNPDGTDILPVTSMDGIQSKTFYVPTGTTAFLAAKKIAYLKIEIMPFDEDIWEDTFNLDFDAVDDQSGQTYRERIKEQAAVLKELLGLKSKTEPTAGKEQTSLVEGENNG